MRAIGSLVLASGALVAGVALSSARSADAAIIQATSRAALGSTVFNLAAFGPAGTGLSTPVSATDGGVTVQLGSSAGVALIRQEGNDFIGDFAIGDTLVGLPDGYRSDQLIYSFPQTTVYGFGAQVQPASGYTGPFTAYLDLYGPMSVFLGEVSVTGNSTTAEDNSAPFLGAISTTTPIAYAIFFESIGYPGFPREGDILANQLSILLANVPEPASLAVVGLGLAALGATKRRRRA